MIEKALKTLEYIVGCDYITLFIFFLLGLLILLRPRANNKKLLLFIIFSFGWRLFYNITSSRYCLIFVLYSFIFYSKIFLTNKKLFLLVTIVLFSVDTCKCFSSYKNNYIFDVTNYCRKITSDNPKYKLFITEKESYRIGRDYPQDAVEVLNQRTNCVDYVANHYRYLFGGKYVIIEKERTNKPFVANNGWNIKKVSSNHTNDNNTGFLNIYLADFSWIAVQNIKNDSGKNLIYNGDYEKIQAKTTTLKSFSKWINNGADFYKSDYILLPEYQLILDIWDENMFQSGYPRVYSEKDASISGESSLHVILEDIATVYLQNKIPAKPGTLSFNIKNLKEKLCLKLNMIEYNNGAYNASSIYYGIEIFDNNIHQIQFQVNGNDISGDTLLFRLIGADQEFLIDDIKYIVNE